MNPVEKKIIGRSEKIDLPEFNLFGLDSKVDTGAAICAIHCHEIKLTEKEGQQLLEFRLLDPSHPDYNEHIYYSHQFKLARIKNSFGQTEERYVVTTPVVIFDETIETQFSLSDRKDLKFPILLGRRFLRKRFIVDVAKRNVSFKKSKKRK